MCKTLYDEKELASAFGFWQDLVPKEQLMKALETEFINRTNDVGIDVNRAIEHSHVAVLVQFICGLGPRKGGDLLKVSSSQSNFFSRL